MKPFISRRATFFGSGIIALSLIGCTDVTDESVDESVVGSTSAALTSIGGLEANFVAQSVWNEGYCGEVVVTNRHASATVGTWKVSMNLGASTITQAWSSTVQGSTGAVQFSPLAWNSSIAPGTSTRFGFCARTTTAGATATVTGVTDDLPGGTCVEQATIPAQGRVQMRVSNVDDYVYLTVNGIRRKSWHYGTAEQNQLIDVSAWFAAGNNDVRIQAMNGGGPANYHVELLVDGYSLVDETCPASICNNTDISTGIWLDKKLTVSLSQVPAAQAVTLTSASPGPIYVNGQYLGKSTPATVYLPPGSYTIGLGQSNDTPGSYTGSFFEETVSVANCPKQVNLSEHAALPVKNRTRVAVLPIRNTVHGDAADIGVLADSDVPYMLAQANATSSAWVQPFSYGLTAWDVTALPIVENVTLQRGPSCMDAPNTGLLLEQAGLTSLTDQYDMVMFLYSSYHADGSEVAHVPCAIWAGGKEISYYTGWMRWVAQGQPSEGLYHESLHTYEWLNSWQHGYYNGVEGLHGAEEHGYREGQGGETGWLSWYRAFARNQAAELVTMREGVTPSGIPTTSDLYIGVFDTMRYGTSSAPSSASAASKNALVRAAAQEAVVSPDVASSPKGTISQ